MANVSPTSPSAVAVSEDVAEEVIEMADPEPEAPSFPPYPPYAVEPVPPSLADTILAGRNIRVYRKAGLPRKPARPAPRPARPRGPKATDVKLTKRATRAHARCLRAHNAVLTDRLEYISKPQKRKIICLWRDHGDLLPADTIARLRNMLDADEPFKPDQAYEYFINLRKTRKRNKTMQITALKKDVAAMCADKRFVWARNATVAFARGIQQKLSRPGRYALADGMLRLSNIILSEISNSMHVRPPSRRSTQPKAKFMMEMSDKIAIWIDEILSDSDDRMLMMDFDEDNDVLNADDYGDSEGYADSFLDMMGGAGGPGGGKRQSPAYKKLTGDMAEAFKALTDEMYKKGDAPLVNHGNFKQSYKGAADELKKAEDLGVTATNQPLAQKLNKDLTNTISPNTPSKLAPAVGKTLEMASNYLAQNAEFNKIKGPAFDLLLKQMKAKGEEPLLKKDDVQKTYNDAAKDLENAKYGFETTHDDPNLSQEINSKMTHAVNAETPPHLNAEMKEVVDIASKYISENIVNEKLRAEGKPTTDDGFYIDEHGVKRKITPQDAATGFYIDDNGNRRKLKPGERTYVDAQGNVRKVSAQPGAVGDADSGSASTTNNAGGAASEAGRGGVAGKATSGSGVAAAAGTTRAGGAALGSGGGAVTGDGGATSGPGVASAASTTAAGGVTASGGATPASSSSVAGSATAGGGANATGGATAADSVTGGGRSEAVGAAGRTAAGDVAAVGGSTVAGGATAANAAGGGAGPRGSTSGGGSGSKGTAGGGAGPRGSTNGGGTGSKVTAGGGAGPRGSTIGGGSGSKGAASGGAGRGTTTGVGSTGTEPHGSGAQPGTVSSYGAVSGVAGKGAGPSGSTADGGTGATTAAGSGTGAGTGTTNSAGRGGVDGGPLMAGVSGGAGTGVAGESSGTKTAAAGGLETRTAASDGSGPGPVAGSGPAGKERGSSITPSSKGGETLKSAAKKGTGTGSDTAGGAAISRASAGMGSENVGGGSSGAPRSSVPEIPKLRGYSGGGATAAGSAGIPRSGSVSATTPDARTRKGSGAGTRGSTSGIAGAQVPTTEDGYYIDEKGNKRKISSAEIADDFYIDSQGNRKKKKSRAAGDDDEDERRKKRAAGVGDDDEAAVRRKKAGRVSREESETDPDREAALNILHKELHAKGSAILYKQPHTEVSYSEASKWLKRKPRVKIDKAVKESADTARLHNKFEKKLDDLVSKKTPANLKDAMQDVVIESSRILSENFVANNYKGLVTDGLIAEMQNKGNEILVEIGDNPETFFYAAQRLKKAQNLEAAEPCDGISYYLEKQLDDTVRNRPMPRKVTTTMKEHVKDASEYLSEHVTKPDEEIEAYVALLSEMEAAGDALLFEGEIPKSYRSAAAYLGGLTSYEDQINRPNASLKSATESKLKSIMANVPLDGYSTPVLNQVISQSAGLLVSHIMLQGEKTEALNVLTQNMTETGPAVLLRHGSIRKNYNDGADLLVGKNADKLNVTSADPVVSRKIQLKLINLMRDKTPDKYQNVMGDVIEDTTMYLAHNLLQPRTIKVCKCMKNETIQCELWCEEILRHVEQARSSRSRHASTQASAELARASKVPDTPGREFSVRPCPSNTCPALHPTPSCQHAYMMYAVSLRGRPVPEPRYIATNTRGTGVTSPARRLSPGRGSRRGQSPVSERRLPIRSPERRHSVEFDSPRSHSPLIRRRSPNPKSTNSNRARSQSPNGQAAHSSSDYSPSHYTSPGDFWRNRTQTRCRSFRSTWLTGSRMSEQTSTPQEPCLSTEPSLSSTPSCTQNLSLPHRSLISQTHSLLQSPSCFGSSVSPSRSSLPNTTLAFSAAIGLATHIHPLREMEAPNLTISTDQMSDWHAMMVSLMWNVQAWRDWIQENVDRTLSYQPDPNITKAEADENWASFQRRVSTEALQWMQYNKFSCKLTTRLAFRYRNKQIVSSTNSRNKTETYAKCQQEMFEIIEMFNKWTQWLAAVVKETNSMTKSQRDIPLHELHWRNLKMKVQEYSEDWRKYNLHLKVCWEQKYKTLIAEWLPAWKQPGPVWVMSACGAVPSGAVAAGLYEDEVIWVARTTHRCDVLPAALHPSKHCCIAYSDNAVHHCTKYQVMCNVEAKWAPWRAGAAAACARAVDVAPGVRAGRVLYRGAHLLGPVRAPDYKCHVVIFGRPFSFNCYELLVLPEEK